MSEHGTPPPPPGPEGSSYGQMPQMDPSQAPPAPVVTRPPAMDQAVMLMKVGAGVSLLGIVITLISRSALRDAVQKASENAGTTMTSSQIDAAVTFGMISGIVGGLIAVGLWLWMASANGKGRSWARIVATVLFAINVASQLFSLLQPGPVLPKLLGVVILLLGAYIMVLVWKKESTEFYRASSARV